MDEQTTHTEKKQMTLLEESFEEMKQMKIVRFFDRMLESKYGLYFLPLIVLVDVYLLILPLEPILAVYAIKHQKIKIWMIAMISTVVSLFGYLSLYWLGFYFSDVTLSIFGRIFDASQITEAGALLSTPLVIFGQSIHAAAVFGFTSALASVPIPLSVFTFSVGVFKIAVVPFTIMFFIGRFVRYYLSAWVGRKYGVAALEAVFKNVFFFALFLLVSIAVLIYKIS